MLIKNIVSTFARQLLAAALGLITVTIIARSFGPSGNGALTIALLLPTLLTTFLNLGLSSANIYFVGSGQMGLPQVIRANFRVFYGVATIGLIAGAICISMARKELFPGIEEYLLWIALLIFPIALLNIYIQSLIQATESFGALNYIILAQSVVVLVLTALVAVSPHRSVQLLIIVQAVSQLIILFRFVSFLRGNAAMRGRDSEPTVGIKPLLQFGWKAHLSNMVAFFNYRADIFFLNIYISPVAVGVYAVAVLFAEKLSLISQAIGTVMYPRLSKLSSNKDVRDSLTPSVSRLSLFITTLAGLLLIVIASKGIRLIFGSEYSDAFYALLVLVPGYIIASSSQVIANDIAARGRPELNLITSLVALVANILGSVALIPLMGMVGAGLSITISLSANALLKLVLYSRITGVKWQKCIFLQRGDLEPVKRYFSRS